MNQEESDSIKNLSKLSLPELEKTKRNIKIANKFFHICGIISILTIFIWPGVFTVVVGGISIYIFTLLSLSSDYVRTVVEKNIALHK